MLIEIWRFGTNQLILQAFKKAHESSTTTMKERMNDLTGGLNLNLPGFDNSDS